MLKKATLHSKKKIFSFIKIITFFLVVYFFFKFINQENLISTLAKISIEDIFFIYLLYLSFPIIHTLRWFIIIKEFSKITFMELLRSIIKGYSFNLILSSTLAIDASKFIKIKKEIGYKNSLMLLSIDKFFALFFKLIFLSICTIFYLYFYTQVDFNYKLVSIFFSFILILFFSKIDKIIIFLCKKIFFKKKCKKYLSDISENQKKYCTINSCKRNITID